jgi:hypothetical protein
MKEILEREGYSGAWWGSKWHPGTEMADEAISELADAVVNDFAGGARQFPRSEYGATGRNVDIPDHDDSWDSKFVNAKRHGPPGARGSQDPLSDASFYLTLWLLFNGRRDPDPLGDVDAKIEAMKAWFEKTFGS